MDGVFNPKIIIDIINLIYSNFKQIYINNKINGIIQSLNQEEERILFEVAKCELKKEHCGRRYSTRVFTEQGIAMLATILRTKVAIQVSIAIMDAFVLMRRYISTNNYATRISNIETKLINHDNKINEIFIALESKKIVNEIYFNGQIYDAYSKIVSIMKESKQEITIIDNYADITILDMISKKVQLY